MKNQLTLLAIFFSSGAIFAQDASFECFSFTGRDLFPSAIISTATVDWSEFDEVEAEVDIEDEEEVPEEAVEEDEEEAEELEDELPVLGDPNGWFGVTLHDVPAGAEIVVELRGDGWLKPSKFVGIAEDEDGEPLEGDIDVMPKAVWDYEALRKVTEQRPVNLIANVTIDGEELPEQTETMVLRSVNDCPFFVLNGEDEDPDDVSWCFVAYVNENHPWIDELLKEALTTAKDADGGPLLTAFTGYQAGDPAEVTKQVFAIWQVLQRRGIKYSDISTTIPSKTVISQTVRFVDQTIEATQANCVDGSVLMASILTKIGLNVYLVLVPGHCFLAFDADRDGENLFGLETTMLGQDSLKSAEQIKALEAKVGDKEADIEKLKGMVAEEAQASINTYLIAIDTGVASLQEHAEAFASGDDPSIQLISVGQWRQLGIMPLASGRERKQ